MKNKFVLVGILIVILGISGYVILNQQKTAVYSPKNIDGWDTYRNDEVGFEVQYPDHRIKKDSSSIDLAFSKFVDGSYMTISWGAISDPKDFFITEQTRAKSDKEYCLKILSVTDNPAGISELPTCGYFEEPQATTFADTEAFIEQGGVGSEAEGETRIIIPSYGVEIRTRSTWQGKDIAEIQKQILETFRFVK